MIQHAVRQFAPHHIVGHRGARAEAPENTLGGFRYLRNLGIQKVELDVHLSQDDQLMVIHDTTTDRTTNTSGAVNETLCSTLMTMNATHDLIKPWPYVEFVPTLNQVIGDWPHLEHIQIEVKPLDGEAERHRLGQLLAAFCQNAKLNPSTTVITSSDQAFLAYSISLNSLPHGLVADETIKKPLQDAQKLGCALLALEYSLYTETLAQACTAAQMPVSLWTVNDIAIAKTMIARGAQSIITDKPGEFLEQIEHDFVGQ